MINARSWSVFHDGEITSVSGDIPGNLEFTIEAEYLRKQFADPGAAFKIHVAGCDLVTFKSFQTNESKSGIDALAGQNLEILSARQDGDALAIMTADGVITIRYQSEILALDTGRVLELSDVAAAADRAVADRRKPST